MNRKNISRRAVLSGLGSGLLLGASGAAFADLSPEGALRQYRQAKRNRQLLNEARQKLGLIQTSQPTLSMESVIQLEGSIRKYRALVNQGGWNLVPANTALRRGSRGDEIVALRRRLVISGDLASNAAGSSYFDETLQIAVQRFQMRHGLKPDAVVGRATYTNLNTPAHVRLQQLQINLGRVQTMVEEVAATPRYVLVNIPAAAIEAVSVGQVDSRHSAVVGKIDRQTPIINSDIHELNFNPYWTVPRSIIKKDLIPLMQKEPDYLTKNEIRIFTWKGKEIHPTEIDWFSEEAMKYKFRQDPGAKNSLGRVRINFANDHQVYLHDTPSRELFTTDNRFHSSGCVRVGDVDKFITWLLQGQTDWTPGRVEAVIETGEQQNAPLLSPVPLKMAYVTAWSTQNDITHFRDDIYRLDGASTARSLASN